MTDRLWFVNNGIYLDFFVGRTSLEYPYDHFQSHYDKKKYLNVELSRSHNRTY